jgi:hypothetical protein
MQGGFITFPQATYAADPAGTIQSEYVARDLVTMATPALHGTGGGAFYDASMRRWVPVPAGQASPDGKRYAYVTGESPNASPAQVHIVNVVDGSEAVVTIGPNPELNEWRIGDYDGSLVFLLAVDSPTRIKVWHLDPTTGSNTRYVDQYLAVLKFQHGQVWVGSNVSSEMPPTSPGGTDLFDDVWSSYDPYYGKGADWIYRQGMEVFFLGLDGNDHPIVSIAPPPHYDYTHGDIRLITSPGAAGLEISNRVFVGSPQPDTGRIWFSNNRGIYLFTAKEGLRKVFAFTGNATFGESLTPAGYCR